MLRPREGSQTDVFFSIQTQAQLKGAPFQLFVGVYPASSFICMSLSVTALLLAVVIHIAHSGKVVVFLLDGDHWMNMSVLVEELQAGGGTHCDCHSRCRQCLTNKFVKHCTKR